MISVKEIKIAIYLLLTMTLLSCQKGDSKIIGTTESFIITSTNVNDDFKIYVYLPPNYPQAHTKYPLIIELDGDSQFENTAAIISQQINDNTIPPVILIGIGYRDADKRNRDYTPTKTQVESDETGGAKDFYRFIQKELIPKLENNYQLDTANTKTLMGHSYGGLFTLFAMFQERSTNPFDKFIPIAASFWYDSGVIFELEENYSSNNLDFPVTVYTAMGSLEGTVMVASFEEMNERMINRNYQHLVYKSEVLKKYGHSRSNGISYKNGLNYVFNN